MKIDSLAGETLKLNISLNELEILNNALNEVCNALSVQEFQTRMGGTLEEAKILLDEISDSIDIVMRRN